MWNLTQVFTENAQRATLLTALLSTAAAVAIVLLTHYLAQRRAMVELRVKKFEETYAAIAAYADVCVKCMTEMSDGPLSTDCQGAYGESHSKVEMLCAIYAPDLLRGVEVMNQIVKLTGQGPDPEPLSRRIQVYSQVKDELHLSLVTKIRGRRSW